MPVPDHVIFGPDNSSGRFTYGEVRAMAQFDQHHALKGRMDTFFIAQVKELAKSDDDSRKVYAPFPLFLLTCVGIETLGKVLYRPKKMNDEEMDLERSFKKHKLGRWNVGLQKGLTKYVGDTYDVERSQGLDDEMGGGGGADDDFDMEDAENNDLTGLDEDGQIGGEE